MLAVSFVSMMCNAYNLFRTSEKVTSPGTPATDLPDMPDGYGLPTTLIQIR